MATGARPEVWILALNTATDALGVGVLHIGTDPGQPGDPVGVEILLEPPARRSGHSERLMPTVDEAMRLAGLGPAELGGVAVVAGPGGFTGVRTGLAAAKLIAQARGIPVWGLDTLDVLAAGCSASGLVAAMLDARRGDVFAAIYRPATGGQLAPERLDGPRLVALETFLSTLPAGEAVSFVGEGALRHRDLLARHPGARELPAEAHSIRPATIARLAAPGLLSGGMDPLALLPSYQRPPTMAPDWVAGAPR